MNDTLRPSNEEGPEPEIGDVRLSDTDRLETFSDSVFAITITLLVSDIVAPGYQAGRLLEQLLRQWADYVAFLASFSYVGIIWLNHRAVFSRVHYCSRSLHFANLLLLLTSGLIPFPTIILSDALQRGNAYDSRVAVAVYALVGGFMCLSWLLVFHVLSRNHHLLEPHVERTFFPKERQRAAVGVVLYAVAGAAGWVVAPLLALLIFLALPVFYGITSEGLVETRAVLLRRLEPRRNHRRTTPNRHGFMRREDPSR